MRLVLAAVLREDSCCVDVGANIGEFLALCCHLAPHGQHVAYEPLPALAADLQRRFPGHDVRARAVADGRRTEAFAHVVDEPARSGLGTREGYGHHRLERLRVDVVDLDSDLPEDCVPAIIKFDVEGTEALAIRGAAQTIRRHRPLVIFEHGWSDWAPDLHRTVADLDMGIFDLDGQGPYHAYDFVRAIETGGGDQLPRPSPLEGAARRGLP